MSLEKNLEKNIKDTKNSYNELPYMSKAFSFTLPENQSVVARVLGLPTSDVGTSRVLEIGCSYGGNILSFAMGNPNADIVGIDLSEHQIEQGQKLIEYLGLKNIKLYHKNILDFDESFGKFDYIICHGVFSWVPSIVQDKILEVIRKHLSENGTAVISYNTYPGWKRLEFFKDAMLYRVKMLKNMNVNIEMKDKVGFGRGILEFLEEHSGVMSEEYKALSKDIREKDTYYLYHEYYEENNSPIYFYDFNQKIEEAGLTYVGDTEMAMNFPYLSNKELGDLIDRECGTNQIAKIQYYDFLRNTQFRRSILTHKENKDKINFSEHIGLKNLQELFILIGSGPIDGVEGIDKEIIENLHKESSLGTIKIQDFIEKYYKEEEYKEIYKRIFILVFFAKKLGVSTQKRERKSDEKLKINDWNRKMIEYLLQMEVPIVGYSNFLGYSLNLETNELETMHLFDGEKTDEDIIKILEEINIKPEFNEEEIKAKKQSIVNFVVNLRDFIERNYLNLE